MQAAYDMAPVVADIISAHRAGSPARQYFMHACLGGYWDRAADVVEDILAEPGSLRGHQEQRLREFLELIAPKQ